MFDDVSEIIDCGFRKKTLDGGLSDFDCIYFGTYVLGLRRPTHNDKWLSSICKIVIELMVFFSVH